MIPPYPEEDLKTVAGQVWSSKFNNSPSLSPPPPLPVNYLLQEPQLRGFGFKAERVSVLGFSFKAAQWILVRIVVHLISFLHWSALPLIILFNFLVLHSLIYLIIHFPPHSLFFSLIPYSCCIFFFNYVVLHSLYTKLFIFPSFLNYSCSIYFQLCNCTFSNLPHFLFMFHYSCFSHSSFYPIFINVCYIIL